MTEVARVRTALTDSQAAPLLVTALRGVGIEPSREQARLLLAQLRFEGLGSCNNHNVGNITTRDDGSRDFFRPTWFEVDASSDPKLVQLHAQMEAGKAPRAFRSYPDFAAGFADYAHELQKQFPSILAAAGTGDAQATANAIKSSGYTPDAPSSLGTTLASIVHEFDGRGLYSELPLVSAGPPRAPSPPSHQPALPLPTGPSSPSSSSPPSSPTLPAGVVENLAQLTIWRGDDGARGFTIAIGPSIHSGKLEDLVDWLSELGLLDPKAKARA